MVKSFVALVASLAVLAGCANTPRGKAVEIIAVQYATMKLIEEGSPKAKEKAAKIAEAARKLLNFAESGETSLSLLRAEAYQLIEDSTSLDGADKLLAVNLVDLIVLELADRVQKGLLSPDKLVELREVLQTVIRIAEAVSTDTDPVQ